MNHRLILAAALALATPAAFCQAPSTPPPAQDGQMQQGPPQQKRHFEMRVQRDGQEQGPNQMIIERREFRGEPGGPEGFGPGMQRHKGMHGQWWKNPELAKDLALTPDQIKKLDEISFQGKLNAIHLRAALEEQELLLKPILESPTLDEKKANLQIDKIAEARAALEKSAAKQKIASRSVLTADQWTKLQQYKGGHVGALCPGCQTY